MDLTLGPEQEAIRDSIRGVLNARLPMPRVRAVVATPPGVDAEVWRVAGELGWFGLGGPGYGLPEAALLFVELGRSLAPGPWLGTVLAARALEGAPALASIHADILAGRQRVAVVDDPADALGPGDRLAGVAGNVADAGAASGLLVLGATAVRYLASGMPGVHLTERASMDPTRRIGRATFEQAPTTPLADDAARLRQMGTVLVAAEAVGVAERTLEASVEYAKVRHQFGRPIGAFQAVKHRCADMAVRVEMARAAVLFAAVAARDGESDAPFHVRVAKLLATSAALANATDNVQNHGGMGYTWEADAHFFLKRAHLLEHIFGTRTAHLDALAAPWRAAR